jgi:signal transduction histidine kinase
MMLRPGYEYQVGGSLKLNALSYVARQADAELYDSLIQGELCYVFNSRQMGKSSLRLRTKQRLQQAGMRCASIDLARIGSKTITPEQWYTGIVVDVVRGFDLFDQFDFVNWGDSAELSLIQRLSQFIEGLLKQVSGERLFIFLDEIDSVLSLDFAVDDFFALIRYCYNQRAENPAYERLGWALFGVATPSDLIRDPALTPFNIGRAIDLQGFKLAEVQPLIDGLEGAVSHPQTVLKEILNWTGGQPFLTQKLCRIVAERGREHEQDRDLEETSYQLDQELPIANPHLINFYYSLPILAIERLVRSHLIDQWEVQDQPEHLKTIRDRLLQEPQGLLELYQTVLQGAVVEANDAAAMALLLSGVVTRRQGKLQVANRIYQEVFNLDWVEQQLAARRPYAAALQRWLDSERSDAAALLRGEALQQAQRWAMTHRLSDLDYQFLISSQAAAWREFQQESHSAAVLIAHLSHELRTPLHAILGFTQRLERDLSLQATQQEHLRIIHQNADHLLTLITHLLELSKAAHQPTEPTALPSALATDLTPELLVHLDLDWVKQMHQAALCTDEQQILGLLAQLPAAESQTAAVLSEWVNQFRCDKILELTQLLQSQLQ